MLLLQFFLFLKISNLQLAQFLVIKSDLEDLLLFLWYNRVFYAVLIFGLSLKILDFLLETFDYLKEFAVVLLELGCFLLLEGVSGLFLILKFILEVLISKFNLLKHLF